MAVTLGTWRRAQGFASIFAAASASCLFTSSVDGVQIGYSAYRQCADVIRIGSICLPR
jgi:hypothetical protein